MSRNGDSQVQELIHHHQSGGAVEPSTTAKLTWQWQKKASLRNIENLSNRIENSLSDVREKLSSIQTEVETSRKEDKREIKLLLDDLAVSRAKSTRLEKTIEEMKKDKMNILKIHEEIVHKRDDEIKANLKSYEDTISRKDEDLKNVKKEAKLAEMKKAEEHDKELKLRDTHVHQLEVKQTQKIASLIGDKDKMKNEYENKLQDKCVEISSLHLKYQAEAEDMQQAKEAAVNELNEKIEELNLKLSEAILYLKNSLQLIDLKNSFIAKQRQGFEKIIDHVGESQPKAIKLKGNLWKLAHYMRTAGQTAWKGYINRAQWEAAMEDAEQISRISHRALADYKFEAEDEPQFRLALQELQQQLQQTS